MTVVTRLATDTDFGFDTRFLPPGFTPINPFAPPTAEPGLGVCPPGTACNFLGVDLFGFEVCLGSCEPINGTARPSQPPIPSPSACPPGTIPVPDGVGGVTCQQSDLGQAFNPRQPRQDPRSGCPTKGQRVLKCNECILPGSVSACRPNGRVGRIDQSGCCVPKARRTDFGNIKAAKRAGKRISGSIGALESLKAVVAGVIPPKRKRAKRKTC